MAAALVGLSLLLLSRRRSGAARRSPSRGVITCPGRGRVSEEPWSPRFAVWASDPITAKERSSRQGSSSAWLRSSTIDSVAAWRARRRWAGLLRTVLGTSPGGIVSCNCSWRRTASFRRCGATWPSARACSRQPSHTMRKGISRSWPACRAFTPSRIPKMKSLTTNPSNPQRPLRI